jgi:superfamily II RNA helicase
LISSLRGFDLLPAIIFLPTRRKCDEAASEVAGDRSQQTDQEKFERRRTLFDEYAVENPEVRHHKHVKILVNAGVASHHAGHIPAWKLLVEKMMSAGMLNAIFATSTVAAGVDFPARTVVISNADTRGNDGWRPFQASELQQMTGRAGRRGRDNVGFVVLAPGQFQNPKKIAELLKAPPDPLESRFRSTYTSLLNLLDAFKNFEQVREIAEKSFAFRDTGRRIEKLRTEIDKRRAHIEALIANTSLTFDDVRGFERLVSARNRMTESIPASRAEIRQTWLRENVVPGRVVSQGRSGKRFYLVFNVHGDKVSAMRDDGGGTNFPLSRVSRVFRDINVIKGSNIERIFFDVFEHKNPPLEEPKLSGKKQEEDAAAAVLSKRIDEFGSPVALWDSVNDAEFIERRERDIDFLRTDIWEPFVRRARVLNEFGYVDFIDEKVTAAGKWLADLRVDRPLLVGEGLRSGVFDNSDPKIVAGVMAAIAADADRNYGELYLSDQLLDTISNFEEVVYRVSNVEWKYGIEPAEEINLSAAAAAERWAGGMAWDDLVRKTGAEEGDLVRLLSRTGEALLQVAQLRESNPGAASVASTTADILLREPIR